ncbi:MAG: nucleotide sugar dehydrogenase [Rhodospirillaceae bacterium]
MHKIASAGTTTTFTAPELTAEMLALVDSRQMIVGIIGMGYVGLPLARTFAERGFRVVGFDIDSNKVDALMSGRSYIKHITPESLAPMLADRRFRATTDFDELSDVDAILVCVPTPLNAYREPDMSYIAATSVAIGPRLRRGHIVSLESTTYPGTTSEFMRPILERGGLRSGRDFFLVFSPEREDPGNPVFSTACIPKVVGGDGSEALAIGCRLYGAIVPKTVSVSSLATAEAVKLTENIFRSVNIALVNELKLVYAKMGIDVWEVIDAAKTKPFGFMPFYPGPGLGGHCIPIDPFYLTWKAREFGLSTQFIELAGQINTSMPLVVVQALADALNLRQAKSVNGARILLLGMAYKKNVDDIRESPAFELIELLEARGAAVSFYDPYVEEIPSSREHKALSGRRGVAWDLRAFADYDAALICTDHDGVDYAGLVVASKLVIDTRNATRNCTEGQEKIIKA